MKMFACKFAQDEVTPQRLRVGSKKHALSLPEGSVQTCPEVARRESRSHFDAQSVHLVREHGKMATCLRACASKRSSAETRSRSGEGRERRWPACRAYSAEVASATKAGSSGVGTAAFFNSPTSRNLEAPQVQSDMMSWSVSNLNSRACYPNRLPRFERKNP